MEERIKNLIEVYKSQLKLSGEYREVKIPKRTSGFRTLFVPSDELKKVQEEILKFLKELFPARNKKLYGLTEGSIREHGESHFGSRFFFIFDLEDAFYNVDIEKIRKRIIEAIKKTLPITPFYETRKEKAEELANLIIKLTTYNSVLPQGSPTSPFLFALYLEETEILEKLQRLVGSGKVTCYIDEFVISDRKPFSQEKKKEILDTLIKYGFKINHKKIREYDCREKPPLICGVRVDGLKRRISLPKKKIRRIRGLIYRAWMTQDPNLIRKIEGMIAFLQSIYDELPNQIRKPYIKLISSLTKAGSFLIKNTQKNKMGVKYVD